MVCFKKQSQMWLPNLYRPDRKQIGKPSGPTVGASLRVAFQRGSHTVARGHTEPQFSSDQILMGHCLVPREGLALFEAHVLFVRSRV